MPLSEHEQRLLEQIERALYAEDPKFASTVRGGRMRKPSRRRRLQGISLFLAGLVLLIVGVMIDALPRPFEIPVVSVFGFLVMFAGVTIAVLGGRGKGKGGAQGATGSDSSASGHSSFTQRMEDRFRRRFEEQ
jgi:hypothetical protein